MAVRNAVLPVPHPRNVPLTPLLLLMAGTETFLKRGQVSLLFWLRTARSYGDIARNKDTRLQACLQFLHCLSSAGITTVYGMDDQGWIPGRGKIFLFSIASIAGQPSLLSSGYQGRFTRA
jgi:hypothetical protein